MERSGQQTGNWAEKQCRSRAGKHEKDEAFPTGPVSIFPQGTAAVNLFRADLAGESGARNNIRGDGFFGVDLGLTKRWKMPWSEKTGSSVPLGGI